jgi:F-box/leucine-rich repeat protein 2/20
MYLQLEDVCGLDSALCNKRRRTEFLELVSRKVLLFKREEICFLPRALTTTKHRGLRSLDFQWILKRGIHLASFHPYSNVAVQQSICDSSASPAHNGLLDKLESMRIMKCTYMKDADVAIILSRCYGSVKSIDLRGCGSADSSAALIKFCTKLEAFAPNGNESAAATVAIFESCRKLRRVNLRNFKLRLTDEVLNSMAAHCALIEHLDISECTTVSDAAIRRIAESCPLLWWIDLFKCNITDATVVSLCNHCPLLTQVFLGCCGNLTDAAVLTMANRLSGLTYIGLRSIYSITSSAVEVLATSCPHLVHIDLGFNHNITDHTLKKIAEQCSKLKEFRLNGCIGITVIGLTIAALKCSHLRRVTLFYCAKVSAESVATLQCMFPLVRWIHGNFNS